MGHPKPILNDSIFSTNIHKFHPFGFRVLLIGVLFLETKLPDFDKNSPVFSG